MKKFAIFLAALVLVGCGSPKPESSNLAKMLEDFLSSRPAAKNYDLIKNSISIVEASDPDTRGYRIMFSMISSNSKSGRPEFTKICDGRFYIKNEKLIPVPSETNDLSVTCQTFNQQGEWLEELDYNSTNVILNRQLSAGI